MPLKQDDFDDRFFCLLTRGTTATRLHCMHGLEVTGVPCSEAYLNAVLRRRVSCDQSASSVVASTFIYDIFSP